MKCIYFNRCQKCAKVEKTNKVADEHKSWVKNTTMFDSDQETYALTIQYVLHAKESGVPLELSSWK